MDEIINVGMGLLSTFITYFLKQTMDRVKQNERDIREAREKYVVKTEYEKAINEQKSEIKQIREDYTPKRDHEKAYDEMRADVKEIKANFLQKDDFLREISDLKNEAKATNNMLLEMLKKRGVE